MKKKAMSALKKTAKKPCGDQIIAQSQSTGDDAQLSFDITAKQPKTS
jgi:hypothetical protein